MKILVTGGAGYLGSVLVPKLLEEGLEVIVIDNFMYNQVSLLHVCHDPKLTIIRGDARDKSLLTSSLKKVDLIFPLACLTGAPLCQKDPWGATSINQGAIQMLLSLKSKDQGIIFPTTNSGYGIGEKDIYCTEQTPLRPISLYGKLKVDTEEAILNAPNTMSFRFATLFGISPRMRLDLLVNDFTYRAVKDHSIVIFEGHFKRNYLHVRDAAKAFLHGINHFSKLQGNVFNVGLSDANLNKLELCTLIKKFVPSLCIMESPIGEDPDKRNYIVSNEKIEKTGFKPDFSLEDGIKALIKGYQILRHSFFSNI